MDALTDSFNQRIFDEDQGYPPKPRHSWRGRTALVTDNLI